MKRQRDVIKQLTDNELIKQVLLSQCFLLILSGVFSLFLFDHNSEWFGLFSFDSWEIFYYGVIPGVVIVGIDVLLMYMLPERYYDDGGINKRIFANRTVFSIVKLVFLIAVSEELLFRGVVQTSVGYIPASIIFALVHIRYLTKPVLLASVLLVSFYLGYMYELTENLLTTITAHFIIDFLSGMLIRFRK